MGTKMLIDHLISQFRDIRRGPLWMGENFETKLGRLNGETPFQRPEPGMHSAAEIVAHLTAWRRDALLKIETGWGRLRDSDAENWPTVAKLRDQGWEQILREFDESLEGVLTLLQQQDDAFLSETYYDQDYGREYEYAYLINGLLHHDLYHLGQLGVILRHLTPYPIDDLNFKGNRPQWSGAIHILLRLKFYADTPE